MLAFRMLALLSAVFSIVCLLVTKLEGKAITALLGHVKRERPQISPKVMLLKQKVMEPACAVS